MFKYKLIKYIFKSYVKKKNELYWKICVINDVSIVVIS